MNMRDELALEEYGMRYSELPADIQLKVRQALNSKRTYHFACAICHKHFTRRISGSAMQSVYEEIEEPIQSICKKCGGS